MKSLCFSRPNSAISEQFCAPHSTAMNAMIEEIDEVVSHVLGAWIGNALERGDEELHGRTPSRRSPQIAIRRFASPITSGHMRFPLDRRCSQRSPFEPSLS